MFDGFALDFVQTGEATLRVRHGGSGPPLLLLHGHPRTHATWHLVAALLADHYTIVCPDLRGYGKSSKPATTADHEPYSKRAMAPVDHLAVLDAVPIGEALARCDARFAANWWHWFFFGQMEKPAERIISADPDAWYRATPGHMGDEAYADYQQAIHDPETVHAMLEDYRAGLGIDRRHDDDDRRAKRRVQCPVLVLWATGDDLPGLYGDVLDIWQSWADVAAALLAFLGESR